jgi:hypothetical protein
VKLPVAVITAAEAQAGDVVLAPDGNVYQYSGGGVWNNMTPVGSYGPLWSPPGDLTLLVRDGKPQVVARLAATGTSRHVRTALRHAAADRRCAMSAPAN